MRWTNLNPKGLPCYDALFWGVDGTSYKFDDLGSLDGAYTFDDYLNDCISPAIEYARNTMLLDSLRIFMSWNVWEVNPSRYIERLNAILARCDRFNLRVVLVLWSNEGAPDGLLGPALDYVTNGTTNELVDVRSIFNPANTSEPADPLSDLLSTATAGFGLNTFPIRKMGSTTTRKCLLQNPGMRNILRGASFFSSTRGVAAPLDVNNVDGATAFHNSIVGLYSQPSNPYYNVIVGYDVMNFPLQVGPGRPLIQQGEIDAVYAFVDSAITEVKSILDSNGSTQKIAISAKSISFYSPGAEFNKFDQANLYVPLSLFGTISWSSMDLLSLQDAAGSEATAEALIPLSNVAHDGMDTTDMVSTGTRPLLDILGWCELKSLRAVRQGIPGLRGVNFLPCPSTSHSLHLSWLPMVGDPYANTSGGFYHEPHCADELDVLQSVGYRNVRVWGSCIAWYVDPTGYMQTLKSLCRLLRQRGMSMTYIVFNAVPAGFGVNPGTSARSTLQFTGFNQAATLSALWLISDTWQVSGAPDNMPVDRTDLTHVPEPITAAEWATLGQYGTWSDTQMQTIVSDYLAAIGSFFNSDADGNAAYFSYDLFNEVNIQFSSESVKALIMDFLKQEYQMLAAEHPALLATVGFAGYSVGLGTQLAGMGVPLAYLSQHAYAYTATESEFQTIATAARAISDEAESLGIPAVMSEFYVTPENAGQMHKYLEIVETNAMGMQSWSYIRNNAYRDGIQITAGARPFDGQVICSTPARQILRSQRLSFIPVSELDINDHNGDHNADHGPGPFVTPTENAADMASLFAILEE